ncbi:MAG: pseudouridine synthase [Prevotellaceae bacterium]|nr:pseudouridine synthase [Prevotellaceae bacterium]
MNNENNYQPRRNSDASYGSNGDYRQKRPRISTPANRNERASFNPNFYKENRPYRASTRVENGENSSENGNYNSYKNENRDYNRPQREGNYGNSYGQRPSYNREGSGNSYQRPYNRDNNGGYQPRPYNRDENSEQRSYGNSHNRGGYNSDNRSSYGDRNQQRSGNNYGNRPHYNSYNRNDNQQGGFRRNNNQGSGGFRPNYGEKFQRSNDGYNPNNKYSQKKQIEYKKQFVDLSQPMRLNKYLANSSTCSRREADEFIAAGVVSVNGTVVTELGTKIIPATDKVLFHDQLVTLEKKVYVLLNKPKNCVTTSDDPQERLTVLDLVKEACSERIYPVGRLDRNTTGVILLTNDGDLTSKLTHPKYDKKKIYQVKLDRDLPQEDLQKLLDGIVLEDGEMKADDVSYIKEDDFRTIGIEIHSGKNRIVRRMFEHLNYRIGSLDRVYFAGLTKKNLPRGKWRYLSESEVNMLKMSN